MARSRNRGRRGLGDPPDTHRRKAAHAFNDAKHHSRMTRLALVQKKCSVAFRNLLTAKGALEEGQAHQESEGSAGLQDEGRSAMKAVVAASRKFYLGCVEPSRG